jgi:DNA polymerase III epsilon subunit-like protein
MTQITDSHAIAGGIERAIAVRAYPVIQETAGMVPSTQPQNTSQRTHPPRLALVFDCETRIDTGQRLTVGFAVVLRSDWRKDQHEVAGLICFADEAALSTPGRLILEAWLNDSLDSVLERLAYTGKGVHLPRDIAIEHQPIETFRESFYTLAYRGHAAVVGFNLPFDLSRLAVRSTPTKNKRGHIFTLISHTDTRGRQSTKLRHPRIRVVPIDGHRALIQFTGTKPRYDGYFLDLKTLGDALTGERHTLASACKAFSTPDKCDHDHDGRVTRQLLDYALNDALVTAELYVAQVEEHRRHPIAKALNQIYSEATIGKAYLEAMGVRLPQLILDPGLDLSWAAAHSTALVKEAAPAKDPLATALGYTTTTYFGGRTECRIRKTITPVQYVDFLSMYATCNSLMGLWEYLTAKRIRVIDATEEVKQFLETVLPDDLFDPATWRHLPAIVEVLPDGDVLPARSRYGDEVHSTYGIGVNPLSSHSPLWYTVADCIAAKLRTGKAPRVLRALRYRPEGKQQLTPVKLQGQVLIDPTTDDFFRQAIVERRKVKQGEAPYDTLSQGERDCLQKFTKVLVNATSYGIYMQMDRQDGMTARVQAHGLTTVEREISGPEKLGPYCFPPLATLITGGARLMLALAEYEVHRRGGQYALMDTDSLAIGATKTGGLIPCLGGRERLPDGTAAIRALSWDEVEAVRDRFCPLNPYGDGESILELEEENYVPCTCGKKHKSAKGCTGERRQLYTYNIASKRYALFNLNVDGDVELRGIADGDDTENGAPRDDDAGTSVRKYSEHGLGAYEAPRDPNTGKKIEKWEREVWQILIGRALAQPVELPAWAYQPALTQIRISTPEQLRWFETYNRTTKGDEKPYAERVKPFNFLGHAMPKPLTALPFGATPDHFCLVAPAGERHRFVNRHDPKSDTYTAGVDFSPKTYADLIEAYDRPPERKFAGPDGQPCRPETRGLLHDLPLVVSTIRHVGKEGNELEAHRAGVISEAERQLEYHDSTLEDLIAKLQQIPTKGIADTTGYDPRTVRRLKHEEFRPSNGRLRKLMKIVTTSSDG